MNELVSQIFGNSAQVTNTIYYFFSSTAQVWAALIAFGGIAIRDRIQKVDGSMDKAFELMVLHLRPLAVPLKFDYWGGMFMEREAFARFMEERGDFRKNLDWFKEKRGSNSFRYFDRPDEVVDVGDAETRVKHAIEYFQGYRASKTTQDNLKDDLRTFIMSGVWSLSLCLIALPFSKVLADSTWIFLIALLSVGGTSARAICLMVNSFLGDPGNGRGWLPKWVQGRQDHSQR